MLNLLGKIAPSISLPNQDGKIVKLSDFIGKWILVYFYPKDDTPGCTTEACSINDNVSQFNQVNAVVLGISADSVLSHKKFKDKYKLTFDLLSDQDKKIIKSYGVWQEKNMMGRIYMGIMRMSFLINPEGKIAKIYEKVKPENHVQEVIKDLKLYG